MAWPGTDAQWQLARQALGVSNHDFVASSRLSLEMVSMHRASPHPMHQFCQARYKGWLITYVQVFKSNTNGLCANVWDLAKKPGGSSFNSGAQPANAA